MTSHSASKPDLLSPPPPYKGITLFTFLFKTAFCKLGTGTDCHSTIETCFFPPYPRLPSSLLRPRRLPAPSWPPALLSLSAQGCVCVLASASPRLQAFSWGRGWPCPSWPPALLCLHRGVCVLAVSTLGLGDRPQLCTFFSGRIELCGLVFLLRLLVWLCQIKRKLLSGFGQCQRLFFTYIKTFFASAKRRQDEE